MQVRTAFQCVRSDAINYYERHIGDYLKDTAHLSLLEHGIYARLLDVYYTRENGIEDGMIARLIGARSKDEITALNAVLMEFFVLEGGIYTQARCDREIERYLDKQRKAKASAEASWNSRRAMQSQSERKANAMRTHSEGNAPRARTSLQTPDTTTEAELPPVGSPKARASKRCPKNFEVTDDLRAQVAADTPGVDLDLETKLFRDHTFKDARTDWAATWRKWVRTKQQRIDDARANSPRGAPQSFRERDEANAAAEVSAWTGGRLGAKQSSNVIEMENSDARLIAR